MHFTVLVGLECHQSHEVDMSSLSWSIGHGQLRRQDKNANETDAIRRGTNHERWEAKKIDRNPSGMKDHAKVRIFKLAIKG